MKRRCWVLLALMLAASGLYACGESGCQKPCKQADACPNVSGNYGVGVQTTEAGCSGSFPLSLSVYVSATSLADYTRLSVTVNGESDEMFGELCNTSSSAFPKLYDFAASAAATVGSDPVSFFIGGQFVVAEGGTIDLCASFVYTQGSGQGACRDNVVLFTSSSLCD